MRLSNIVKIENIQLSTNISHLSKLKIKIKIKTFKCLPKESMGKECF